MSLLDYGEERFIEPLAIETFEDLGWTHINAYDEQDGSTHITGRGSRRDVVLVDQLRAAAKALNPHIPAAGIAQAIEAFTADRSTMSAARANHAVYTMLKRGVTVRVEIDGIETDERVRLINWDDPTENDFLVVNQLWVRGTHHTRRPDVVGFVNGIPLVFVELKADTVPVKDAYDKNLRDYRDTIPQMFWYNAFLILSNGSQALVGSTMAGWEHFGHWKKISDEEEAATVDMQTAIIGTCEPARLLDLIANFTVFQEGASKIVAKNHQYLGVNNVMRALDTLGEGDQRLGVFWHTQGAGKSFSMLFFAQKVLRTMPGNWTFVIVTDRTNLDAQIYKTFARCGAVTEPEEEVRAQDSEHLRQLLREDHRYVFTLIQKFRTESPGAAYPVLSERDDIIVITDEAHRSQYDVFAQNMRDALPNARFLGFTGTPLMGSDEMTRQVFGDYVSIYNFAQSIADGATVPLWYENRIPQLQLNNDDFNDDMEALLDDIQLDEAQEQRLEREFQREYHLITRHDRLDTIAADIVEHFINRGHLGKAMVVSIDKMTTVRMYDLVQHHWQAKLAELRDRLAHPMPEMERVALEERIGYMEATDMAVVVSQSQGEVADFREKGLDILPHRQRMNDEDLAEKFKDPDDAFRIVFVCAMWMTGFDAKPCSTIYLDKPMRNHTLMQTIARANRVFADKPNGIIVDYIGVFRNLQKALAIYGASRGTSFDDSPIRDKDALLDDLRDLLEDARLFGLDWGIDMNAFVDADKARFIQLSDDAADAFLWNEEVTRDFLDYADLIDHTFKALMPHPDVGQYKPLRAAYVIIARKIRMIQGGHTADISHVLDDIEELLDASVDAIPYIIPEDAGERRIDLSQLDFDALRERFRQGRKRTEVEKLKAQVRRKVDQMVALNPTRADYREKLQQLIDAYNAGSRNVDEIFDELLAFVQEIADEDERHLREGLSEEELALFDILTKGEPGDLSEADIRKVKAGVRALLDAIEGKLGIDWRERQQSRADVEHTIQVVLDHHLPDAYDADLYEEKSQRVFNHVVENYYGGGRSVYTEAA